MASDKKIPTARLFKRKNLLFAKKSPSAKENVQTPTARSATRKYTSCDSPESKLDDEDGASSAGESDDVFYFTRDESRASRPVSSADAWLNLADLNDPLARSPSTATWLNSSASVLTPIPAEVMSEEGEAKAGVSRQNEENSEVEKTPSPTEDKIALIAQENDAGLAFDAGKSQSEMMGFHMKSVDGVQPGKGATEGVTQTPLWKMDAGFASPGECSRGLRLQSAGRLAHAHCDGRLPPLVPNQGRYGRSTSLPSDVLLSPSGLISAQSSGKPNKHRSPIRMPESWPGVYVARPPSDEEPNESVSEEELGSLEEKTPQPPPPPPVRTKTAKAPGQSLLSVSATKPPRSTSSSPCPGRHHDNEGDEPMAMRWASSEFLAARVVNELDVAFCEAGAHDRQAKCLTPTLMARSNSLATPRFGGRVALHPSDAGSVSALSYNANSNSMPDLLSRAERPPRRVFVTFEHNFPHASAVNLQATNEVAARCRHLNRKMDRPKKSVAATKSAKKRPAVKVVPPVVDPEQKTVMVRRWVESCSPRERSERRRAKFAAHVKPQGQMVRD